jgi:hypothetical protein
MKKILFSKISIFNRIYFSLFDGKDETLKYVTDYLRLIIRKILNLN